jgi:hypothetical protein
MFFLFDDMEIRRKITSCEVLIIGGMLRVLAA